MQASEDDEVVSEHHGMKLEEACVMSALSMLAEWASIIGAAVGLPSLWLALVQLKRTQKAAESAEAAARDVLCRIGGVMAVVSLEQICGRTRELESLAHDRNHRRTERASLELLDQVARFSQTATVAELNATEIWQTLSGRVAEIHQGFQNAAITKQLDAASRQRLLNDVSWLLGEFGKIASVASERARTGGNRGDAG